MGSGSGGPVLRGGLDKDGNPAFSLFDLGNIAGKRECENQYGKNIFYRLIKDGSKFKDEVSSFCIYLKFPGSGQKETPCASIRGLQRYLMLLGGKVAAEYREIIEGTFTRVMAGDQSLIEVINANAVSQEPVQQAYRAALAQEPVAPVLDDYCLNRKREREDRLFDMEMAERKLELVKLEQEVQEKRIKNFHDSMALMAQIRPDWMQTDARFRLQTEDVIKNIIMSPPGQAAPALTNGEQAPIASLSISQLAQELGRKRLNHADACRAGALAAKRYRALHGEEPSKHRQWVDGAERVVNSYTEADRGLLTAVLHDLCLVPSSQGSSCSSMNDE